MISSLVDTIKGFFTNLKKDKVISYVDYLFNHINASVIPAFDTIIKSKNLEAVKKNKFLPMIYRAANIKASDNYKALEQLRAIFVEISEQESKIVKLVNDLPDVMTSKAMKMKDAAVVTILRDLTSMTSYTLDLLYYIIVDESVSDLPKIKFKRIQEGMANYVSLLNAYGKNFKKTIEDVKNVSDEVIEVRENIEKDMALLEQVASNTGKLVNLPTRNFVGNPIYHFRMWLVDKEVQNYEALKVKKEMIELKVHELQLEQQGSRDKDLSKQIAYYENKLAGIEYKIEKFENSNEEYDIEKKNTFN